MRKGAGERQKGVDVGDKQRDTQEKELERGKRKRNKEWKASATTTTIQPPAFLEFGEVAERPQ